MADVRVDLALETVDHLAELASPGPERLVVERDARRLHPRQHRDQRQLDLAVEAIEAIVQQP